MAIVNDTIRADPYNLLLREKALLALIAAAIDIKDLGKTEEAWQELKRLRQKITQAGLE